MRVSCICALLYSELLKNPNQPTKKTNTPHNKTNLEMAKSPSQESGIVRIKGAPVTFIWISCDYGNVKMRDSFSFSWLQWKIHSYFLLLLFGVRTQILLPSLSSRRRETTSNFLPGFPVKPHKLQLPSSIIYEVRGRCLLQRSEYRGIRKAVSLSHMCG